MKQVGVLAKKFELIALKLLFRFHASYIQGTIAIKMVSNMCVRVCVTIKKIVHWKILLGSYFCN